MDAPRTLPRRTLPRRTVLAGAAGAAAALTLAGAAMPAAAATGRDFVRVRRGRFDLGGRPFRFAGTNCYYLHEKSHFMIDALLADAVAMSIPVLRAWAFIDGTPHNGKALQPEPFVYDEASFDSLDYTIARAGELGIRLVLPLVNNWPDYGGMQQYVTWFLGLPDDTFTDCVNHDRFYTTAAIRDCYRAYASFVTARRNPYTGLRYRDDPTIMTWELGNEPRNRSDKTGAAVLAWADEMSRHLKRLAPQQLVAVGDEGFVGDPANVDYPYSTFEGNKWRLLSTLPAVDYATVHMYPQGWGEASPGRDPVAWGVQWISDHVAMAQSFGRPVVLEEYGMQVDPARGMPDEAARIAAYRRWTDTVRRTGGAGDQFWLLTSLQDGGTLYPDFDGFRVVAGSPMAAMLTDHARAMAAAG